MTVYSAPILGTGSCNAGTGKLPTITIPNAGMEKGRSTVTVRVGTNAKVQNGRNWGLSTFKVTLLPVVETRVVRNRDFTGSSDVSSWTKLNTETYVETPPEVGGCVSNRGTFSILGGSNILTSKDNLVFRKATPSASRFRARFRFWFLGPWAGQTAEAVMERLVPNVVESISLWSQSYTTDGNAFACTGFAAQNYYVDVDATGKLFHPLLDLLLPLPSASPKTLFCQQVLTCF